MPRRRDRLGTTAVGPVGGATGGRPDQPCNGSARPAKPHEDLRLAARPPLPQRQSECSVERRRQARSCRSSVGEAPPTAFRSFVGSHRLCEAHNPTVAGGHDHAVDVATALTE